MFCIVSINMFVGFVYYVLIGECVLGVGDVLGMFLIDVIIGGYDEWMLCVYDVFVVGWFLVLVD